MQPSVACGDFGSCGLRFDRQRAYGTDLKKASLTAANNSGKCKQVVMLEVDQECGRDGCPEPHRSENSQVGPINASIQVEPHRVDEYHNRTRKPTKRPRLANIRSRFSQNLGDYSYSPLVLFNGQNERPSTRPEPDKRFGSLGKVPCGPLYGLAGANKRLESPGAVFEHLRDRILRHWRRLLTWCGLNSRSPLRSYTTLV